MRLPIESRPRAVVAAALLLALPPLAFPQSTTRGFPQPGANVGTAPAPGGAPTDPRFVQRASWRT